jgi:single-stranded-DNA-specific exonuclease
MVLSVLTYPRAAPTWTVGARDAELETLLCRELGISRILAALLGKRGFLDAAEAHKFLCPSLDDLGDPTLLPDYRAAVDAILGARERKELIFVHGDYDVDGITSSAILDRFLNDIGCNVHTHVPHRIREGYGIHTHAVDHAHQMGAKLLLTCDCGIAAHEQVRKARSLGMAVVVTDHHQIAETIPEAQAVINPHRVDSRYPERELSGAGVVFRLCEGIAKELGFPIPNFRRAFLDLACLGTIADVMPLLGENRVIAKFGLERLQNTKKAGLKALMLQANVGQDSGRPLSSYNVGWHLGPRLNAAGRIEDAANALKLLIEKDPSVATELAKSLEAINTDRRTRTQTAVEEATALAMENGYDKHKVVVVASSKWHGGLVGIVAGRLVERFCRPALVATIDEATGACKGSARSIAKYHLADAIWAFPELLSGGGHAMAAGCSFDLKNLEAVRAALNDYAEPRLGPDDLIPKLGAELEVSPAELDDSTVEELAALEPFGCANPAPQFFAGSVSIAALMPTKNPSHVRLRLSHGAQKVAAIAFNLGERLAELPQSAKLDLIFTAETNEFRGERTVQWQIKDFRASF